MVQGKRPLATREGTEEKQSIQKAAVTEKEGKKPLVDIVSLRVARVSPWRHPVPMHLGSDMPLLSLK